MKKSFLKKAAFFSGSFFIAGEALASNASTGSSLGLVTIGAGLTIGLATFGVASAQGKAAMSALEGIARNPSSKDHIFMPFLLGLVFMEFQALLAFVIAILWTLSNT